ncbi:MAG: MATE family efflux transporter [Bacilli bacterium]
MQVKETNKMGIEPVFPLLMSMGFPPMLSMLTLSLYNIVDSVFVAQIGEQALTAVSLAFPLQKLMIACAVGIGVGLNSYISRKLGEKNIKEANNAILHGLLLAFLGYLIFVVAGFFLIRPFFNLFTSDLVILEEACTYNYICVFFSFGCFLHICIEKVFQATGKMVFPMVIQAIGAIINIILDPIMIFGYFGFPAMGVAGAAIATVIGQIVAGVLSLYILLAKKHDVKIDLKNFKFSKMTIKMILAVTVPNTCMHALGSILVIGLNAILITSSNVAVAVFGIYFKLQSFIFMPAGGLEQGAMPIFGYNYGAHYHERLVSTLKYSIIVTGVMMSCGTFLFLIIPEQLLSLFHANAEMIAIGVPALRILGISFIPATISFVLPTLFQAMGLGVHSLFIFLLRQVCVTLPLSFLFAGPFGLKGIWSTFIIAESIAAIVAIFMYFHICKKDTILVKSLEA